MTGLESRLVWNAGADDIGDLHPEQVADAIDLARRSIRCEESEFQWISDCIRSSVSPCRIGSYRALYYKRDSRLVGLALFRRRPLTETVYEIFQIIAAPDASCELAELLLSAVMNAVAQLPCTLLLMELPHSNTHVAIHQALLKQGLACLGNIPDLFAPGANGLLFAKQFNGAPTDLPYWQPALALQGLATSPGSASIIPLPAADRDRAIRLVDVISSFTDEERSCLIELLDEYVQEGGESSYHFLASYADRELVGVVCFGKRPLTRGAFDGYWLCTDPRFRRGGVGKSLMEALERCVVQAGGYLVLLETSESKKYLPARALFESLGYQAAIRLPDFYSARDGLVVFQKYLGPTRFSGPGKQQ